MRIIRPMTVDDAALLSSNVLENDYVAYNAGTTYALAERAIYVAADTHWIIESLQNGNIGHTPTGETADTWWLKVGETNRWKMFDQSVQSQTTNANSIEVEVIADGRADSVALLNLSCASVNVTMTDAIDGEVFNETFSLVSDSGITDWYSYFFEPIVRLSELVVSEMPPYANATIGVTITDTGSTAKCGVMVVGLSRDLGAAQYGLSLGLTDYSVKQQDDFGNYTVLERAYRLTSDMQVFVPNSLINQVRTVLASYRAIPSVYIGADEHDATIVYGFFKDFSIVISYPDYSILNLSLEGLT
jgi:hypothetical protein